MVGAEPNGPPGGVAVAGGLELAGVAAAVDGVEADGLQQSVPVGVGVVHDEGLVDQSGQHVEHGPTGVAGIAADGFGGVERERSGEGAQASEHGPLVGSEQLVAPLDRGEQGLLAGQHRTSPTRQEQEAPVELLGDLVRGHGPAASGSQLQGERDAVQTAADLTHRAGIQIGEREARAGPPGSVCEQAHRVEHRELDDVHLVARGGGR